MYYKRSSIRANSAKYEVWMNYLDTNTGLPIAHTCIADSEFPVTGSEMSGHFSL